MSIRLLTLLRYIPVEPRFITGQDLHNKLEEEGFTVTYRTVQRDLNDLAAILPLQGVGQPLRWSWLRNAELFELPQMGTETALTFKLAELFLPRLLPPSVLESLHRHFQAAQRILEGNGQPLQHWPAQVRVLSRGQPLRMPDPDPKVLQAVYEAVLHQRCLEAVYRRRSDNQQKTYVIHPLGLVLRDQIIYLVGTLWHYTDVIQLVLHRFDTVSVLEDQPCQPPPGFDLDTYIANGAFDIPDGEEIRLVIRVRPLVAAHLEEARLGEEQVLEDMEDDWCRVTVNVRATQQLRWWLQGFGAQVEVLEPASLRAEFSKLGQELALLYR